MSSKPPPLAFAGTGPTQLRTGTSRWATRSASARPFCPSIPGVFSWSTTIAPARSASASRSSRNARSGRSIGPWTSITRTGVVGGAGAARSAAPASVVPANVVPASPLTMSTDDQEREA